MLITRIKKYLDDIIDVAFSDKDEVARNKYKNYTLYILPKESKRTSGMYIYKGNKIEIYNPSFGARHLAKCSIHELSHHIDYVDNGISGHQKPFYDIYTKLIYASMDMGILSKEDFQDNWSSDRNKVMKIVDKYIPHPVDYKQDVSQIIRIYNGYPIKDQVKHIGYKYNAMEQTWEKELSDDPQRDIKMLKNLGIEEVSNEYIKLPGPYYVIVNPGMHINAVIYIKAEGDTYNCRETLKEYHFFFKGEKKEWICKINADEKEHLLMSLKNDSRLKGCRFSILNRK